MSAGTLTTPARVVFRVLPCQPSDETPLRWKVTRSTSSRAPRDLVRALGYFRWQWQAKRFARLHALHVFAAGGRSQVIVSGKDGRFVTEWTYRDDPPRSKG